MILLKNRKTPKIEVQGLSKTNPMEGCKSIEASQVYILPLKKVNTF